MTTYKDIQSDVVKHHPGLRTVKSCWIAHVKELNGLNPRMAPNRINPLERRSICPDKIRPLIEASMIRLGMI